MLSESATSHGASSLHGCSGTRLAGVFHVRPSGSPDPRWRSVLIGAFAGPSYDGSQTISLSLAWHERAPVVLQRCISCDSF